MSGDELRDAIAGALYVRDRFDSPTVVLADAILALPEMQAMLAKDAEIERLRAAGNAMFKVMTTRFADDDDWYAAIAAWEKASRG